MAKTSEALYDENYVSNDSHGDASLASMDPDYELVAVVTRRAGIHQDRDDRLEQYFVPKSKRGPQGRVLSAPAAALPTRSHRRCMSFNGSDSPNDVDSVPFSRRRVTEM